MLLEPRCRPVPSLKSSISARPSPTNSTTMPVSPQALTSTGLKKVIFNSKVNDGASFPDVTPRKGRRQGRRFPLEWTLCRRRLEFWRAVTTPHPISRSMVKSSPRPATRTPIPALGGTIKTAARHPPPDHQEAGAGIRFHTYRLELFRLHHRQRQHL